MSAAIPPPPLRLNVVHCDINILLIHILLTTTSVAQTSRCPPYRSLEQRNRHGMSHWMLALHATKFPCLGKDEEILTRKIIEN